MLNHIKINVTPIDTLYNTRNIALNHLFVFFKKKAFSCQLAAGILPKLTEPDIIA